MRWRRFFFWTLLIFQALSFSQLEAQEFRKFSFFAGLGTSNPPVLFPAWSVEPSYFVKQPKLFLGLRIKSFDRPGVRDAIP
jgi:hypothetical protein